MTGERRGAPDYLRARYYDPQTGQFLTRDPLEAITGQPSGCAGNDPLNSADPTGLGCPWWDLTCYAYQAVYAIGGGIDWTASFVYRRFGDVAELGAGAGRIIATGGACFALVISATALKVSQDHFVVMRLVYSLPSTALWERRQCGYFCYRTPFVLVGM